MTYLRIFSVVGLMWTMVPYLPNFTGVSIVQSIPFPFYMATSLLVLSVAFIFKLFFVTAVQTIAMLSLLLPLLIPLVSKGSTPSDVISVTSWNTLYWDQGENAEEFKASLRQLPGDVLLLQEHIHWRSDLDSVLHINRSHFVKECCDYPFVWTKGELVIASMFPGVQLDVDDEFVMAVRLDTGKGTLNVVNAHVPVHVDVSRSFFSHGFWKHVQDAHTERNHSYAKLEEILQTDAPTIIGGDFNSNFTMSVFRRAIAHQTDASLSDAIRGTYPTGKSIPALWRIDHVLAKNVLWRECAVVSDDWVHNSDHGAVSCMVGV